MATFEDLARAANEALRRSREAQSLAMQQAGVISDLRREHARMAQNAADLQQALERVQMQRGAGDPGIQRVENIPGRRIPFDLLVDIPIGANITAVQQGTISISQEGPFVAVARFATFLSTHQFQYRDPETGQLAAFAGRSFGRYRPIHSVWDFNDGQPISQVVLAGGPAFPGTGAPHVISPSNTSPFRTMESDYRILFENAGSSFPRQNIEVPSPFWVKNLSDPFDLGALDVFERGEVLQFKVLPTHPNNPAFGNINGFGLPNPAFPFADSGFDAHEGISDPNIVDADQTDPITRVPSGVLTIGFHGYRIVQPAGAGPY